MQIVNRAGNKSLKHKVHQTLTAVQQFPDGWRFMKE
jgi:hypothetical protein